MRQVTKNQESQRQQAGKTRSLRDIRWHRFVLVLLLVLSMIGCVQEKPESEEGEKEPAAHYEEEHEEGESGQEKTRSREEGGESEDDEVAGIAEAEMAEEPMDGTATAAAPAERKAMADQDSMMPEPDPQSNTEDYKDYGTNPWTDAKADPQSTFAIDVDTASYSIARRKLMEGTLPDPAAVRVEEFINYFDYSYADPLEGMPFGVDFDLVPSPFAPKQKILRVGVQGKRLSEASRKQVNLTFLVDTSGSMSSADKLGMAKKALTMLVNQLRPDDTIALVTYAGSTSVVLQPTPVSQKDNIIAALDRLESGGSTAMASGLELAYKQASVTLDPNSVNRVLVISDGDANVGTTSHGGMLESIQHYVDEGVTLSVIGVGMGNYKDTRMEQLANKGNGNYFYFDTLEQAERVFVDQLEGTLHVIAKDVKIQVEFDPRLVREYRLIGYENRDIADKDFRNDKVDAGEIGAGHNVTALYEVKLMEDTREGQLATVRIRHKEPNGTEAQENAFPLSMEQAVPSFEEARADTRFAVAVVAFAEHLRKSPHRSQIGLDKIAEMARGAVNQDEDRQEFLELLKRARDLDR